MIGGRSQSIDPKAQVLKLDTAADKYLPDSTPSNDHGSESPAEQYVDANKSKTPAQPADNQRLHWLYDGDSLRQRLNEYQSRGAPAQETSAKPLNHCQVLNADMQEVIKAQLEQRKDNADLAVFERLLFPKNREVMVLGNLILYGPERDYRQGANDAVEVNSIIDVEHTSPLADYSEMKGTYHLKDGDVLPGRAFDVTDPESFYRELLTINFGEDSRAYEVLEEAKRIGDESHKQGRPILEIANKIVDLVQIKFANGQGHSVVQNGVNQTVGLFYQQGGCCRHRSALLQMAFQMARVPSRYVQGNLLGGGPHAWVEVDYKGDGSYSYIYDLNANARGKANFLGEKNGETAYQVGNNSYLRGNSRNFNKVWRPTVLPESGPSNHVRIEVPSIAEVRSQVKADPENYRDLMRDALRNMSKDAKEALRNGVLEGESYRRHASEKEVRRMEKARGHDGVSSPRESMRRGRARARRASGKI